jgi:hypothetical protein
MRLVLGITTHNEVIYGRHIYRQLDTALAEGCFDAIVVLDDGSTDGTWDVIQQYAKKHNVIHGYRMEHNSVIYNIKNRWMILLEHMARFKPDWVHIRAADVIYSDCFAREIKNRLQEFDDSGVHVLKLPFIHLWRSETWYRRDREWGQQSINHRVRTFWKFSKDYSWDNAHKSAGMHRGAAVPTYLGFDGPIVSRPMNSSEPWRLVALHLGHTTHEKKVQKFRWSMEAATAAYRMGRSQNMPPPSAMPPVHRWPRFNGYKGFFEFDMDLRPVPTYWYDKPPVIGPKPVPKSLYSVIREYNKERAEEYKIFYERYYGRN